MSFFSTPISSVPATTATTASTTAGTARTGAPPAPAPADADADAVTVDTMPASPPPEVLDAIGAASDAYDRLAASGQHLHFAIDAPTGKVTVSVTDHAGNVLRTVAPSAALAAASGEPLSENS
jgi:hypothetical protein